MIPSFMEIETGFRQVQDHICAFLSKADGPYKEDNWPYLGGKGGGISRIWEGSKLLEKAGVNFSSIEGASLPPSAAAIFSVPGDTPYAATGVSLVLHPQNPFIPTIHMNIRFFQTGEMQCFGGGVDLTPYYPVLEEIVGYHRQLKSLCDSYQMNYGALKLDCDKYFYLPHRDEERGVGGIFFDFLQEDLGKHFAFACDLGKSITDLYGPFIRAHKDKPFTADHREFQLYRRSRYVEFNLIYDRGTLFGLQSKGRVESILMSMPATAKWKYNWRPEPGSQEEKLTEFFLKPQDWLNLKV